MRYKIPQQVITSFLEHSVNNISPTDGRHIETLAFLVGKRTGDDEINGTDIIFPNQTGTQSLCTDLGKYLFHLPVEPNSSKGQF